MEEHRRVVSLLFCRFSERQSKRQLRCRLLQWRIATVLSQRQEQGRQLIIARAQAEEQAQRRQASESSDRLVQLQKRVKILRARVRDRCLCHGRDKIIAVMRLRKRLSLRIALERWTLASCSYRAAQQIRSRRLKLRVQARGVVNPFVTMEGEHGPPLAPDSSRPQKCSCLTLRVNP